MKKYICQVVRDTRKKEFMSLIQGTLIVAKYETEYNQLIQYACHILAYEDRRRKRFVEGLRPELRQAMSIGRSQNYENALKMVMELEVKFQEL